MSETKLCPFCAEEIQTAAIKCKHCGSVLNEGPIAQSPPPSESFADMPQTIQDNETLRNILTVSNKPVHEIIKRWAALTGLHVNETTRPQPNTQLIKAKKIYKPQVSWPLVFLLLLLCIIVIGIIGLACYLAYLFFGTKEVYFTIQVEQKENHYQVIIEASAPFDDVRADINQLVNKLI